MAVERVLSNLNLISFKTEGGLQNHINELQDGDLVFTPDNSLKGNLFDFKWTDHKLNDISWLNADTFSWQSGDVYVAAYEHLVSDLFQKAYAWQHEPTRGGEVGYTKSETPEVGQYLYTGSNKSLITEVGSGYLVVQNYKTGDSQRFERIDEDIESTNMFAEHETETVDDITIAFYRAEDGHKICLADQEANVQRLYDWMGVAWYYVFDIINKRFKLPRTKYAFTGLRDSVGGYVKAGLPNITGSFLSRSLNSDYPGAVTHGTGAFSFSKKTGANSSQVTITTTSGAADTISFDASRSSSVYGNSNTVQPEATQMYLYFYVGNFERDAVEQTAGLSAELFNGKADKATVDGQFESAKINYVPSGSVTAFAGTTPPTGWLKCDGSAISRATYAVLFAVIGTTYGTGDGSTTFNLPTQSVLPLGTLAPVITGAEHTMDYTKALQFRNQNGNKQTATVLAGIEGSTGQLATVTASGVTIGLGGSRFVPTNLKADLTKATRATAIACIKY